MAAGLLLVRHAQAAGGPDVDDPGLSDAGRAQARALGARLAGLDLATVLHSPRRRARETGEIAAGVLPDLDARSSDLLDDRTPVPSPGRRGDYPDRYEGWFAQVPAGEQDVDGAGIDAALVHLVDLARTAGGPVVAVTHAFVIGWIVRAVLGAPTAAWLGLVPDNTGITVLDCSRPDLRLVAYNDTGHLPVGL